MDTATRTSTRDHLSSGGRLIAADGRALPLQRTHLAARASGGLARTRLEQRFANPHADPLAVTYQLPLPADGAVSAFAFRIGGRRIQGEIDRRAAARERFEEAIASGRSAALLEQERSSLFTQEIGNIPPGAEVVAEIEVDQPLRWLTGGSWEWRFPTAVAPRYLGAPGRVADAAAVTVEVASGALAPRLEFELAIGDALSERGAPESPSHAIFARAEGAELAVALASETGARLDRDVVVRWPVATPEVGATLGTARPAEGRENAGSAYGLLTIVPPLPDDGPGPIGRDLIALIDTSGSMHGEPLGQAKRVLTSMVQNLAEGDRLELVEFSTRPRRWKNRAVAMKRRHREDALRWIARLDAGGGTEMHEAILAALEPLGGESQRQVVLITDGLIGFEEDIVRAIHERLPRSSRVHTVGVGSAVNRTLTAGAARAGRGVEVILGVGEVPDPQARRLLDRTCDPLVVGLELEGSALTDHAPEHLPDLFAGSPALVGVELDPAGGELIVRGRTSVGEWRQQLHVAPCACGGGRPEIASLYGREAIEDLEMHLAAGGERAPIDAAIEKLALSFQLASRLTSWVAVSSEQDVDPGAPARRERMPHELPHGMSIERLGLRETAVSAQPQTMTFDLCSAPCEEMEAPPAPSPMRKASRSRRGLPFGLGGDRDLDDDYRMGEVHGIEPDQVNELTGSIRLFRDGWLVVELQLPEGAWLLPDEVRIVFADGHELLAEIEPGRTTRPGPIAAGQRVRLSLRLPAGAVAERPTGLVLVAEHDTAKVALS